MPTTCNAKYGKNKHSKFETLKEIWKQTTTILVIMDTCDYKPCSHLKQVAKNPLEKTPYGTYSHTKSHISFVTTYTTT